MRHQPAQQIQLCVYARGVVVLCGSGFVKGSKVLHWVLQELLPEKCRMMVFEQPPVAGALYEACRGVDFAVTDAFRAYAAGALASAM